MKELIVKLRNITGASVGDCAKALKESSNDIEKAQEYLQKQGMIKAAKKADRMTSEGIIECYIHSNKKIASMVELLCETDFVARNADFQKLAHEIAMQIAAMSPLFVKPADVPANVIEKQKEIYREQMKSEEKPNTIVEKIISGKLEKYYEDVCLLKQRFFLNEEISVEDHIAKAIHVIGENIIVGKFIRFSIA